MTSLTLGRQYYATAVVTDGKVPPTYLDPTTLTLTIRNAAGTAVVTRNKGQWTNLALGRFEIAVPVGAGTEITTAGSYTVEKATTGPTDLSIDWLDILPAVPPLLTFQDAKDALDKSATPRKNDAELQAVVDAVNDWLESKCGALVPRTVTETATVDGWSGEVRLPTRPVLAVLSATYAGVAVDVTGWTGSRYGRLSGVTGSYPTPASGPGLVVTHRAGMSPIPRTLPLAGKMLIQHLWQWQRTQSPAPAGGFSDDTISIGGIGYGIPNAVADYVEPYTLDVFGGVA